MSKCQSGNYLTKDHSDSDLWTVLSRQVNCTKHYTDFICVGYSQWQTLSLYGMVSTKYSIHK